MRTIIKILKKFIYAYGMRKNVLITHGLKTEFFFFLIKTFHNQITFSDLKIQYITCCINLNN